jgi:hypothetical protein
MPDMREGAEVAPGIITGEADHINDGIKVFPLHSTFKLSTLIPVSRYPADLFWECAGFPAGIAGDLMSLFQKDTDDAGADVAGAAHDANIHVFLPDQCVLE